MCAYKLWSVQYYMYHLELQAYCQRVWHSVMTYLGDLGWSGSTLIDWGSCWCWVMLEKTLSQGRLGIAVKRWTEVSPQQHSSHCCTTPAGDIEFTSHTTISAWVLETDTQFCLDLQVLDVIWLGVVVVVVYSSGMWSIGEANKYCPATFTGCTPSSALESAVFSKSMSSAQVMFKEVRDFQFVFLVCDNRSFTHGCSVPCKTPESLVSDLVMFCPVRICNGRSFTAQPTARKEMQEFHTGLRSQASTVKKRT